MPNWNGRFTRKLMVHSPLLLNPPSFSRSGNPARNPREAQIKPLRLPPSRSCRGAVTFLASPRKVTKRRRPRRLAYSCDAQKKAERKKLASLRQFFVLIAFFFRFSGPINGDPSNQYLIASRLGLRLALMRVLDCIGNGSPASERVPLERRVGRYLVTSALLRHPLNIHHQHIRKAIIFWRPI